MIVTFSAFSLGTSTFVPSLKRAKRLLLLRPATPATGRSGTGAKKLFTILNKFLTILMISPVRFTMTTLSIFEFKSLFLKKFNKLSARNHSQLRHELEFRYWLE